MTPTQTTRLTWNAQELHHHSIRSTHAQLVIAVLRDVPNPRQRLVSTFLDDLEIAHLNARHGAH